MVKATADARTRLQRAALELFGEHGYDRTTAAGIAARAGVTERTFFRHFPDKREVLFDGEAILRDALTAVIAEAPVGPAPLGILWQAFRSVSPMLKDNRAYAKPRHDVISVTPALQEREFAKLAVLSEALAEALRARGIPELRADLAAQTGMAAFVHASLVWLDDPEVDLGERIDIAFGELQGLLDEDG